MGIKVSQMPSTNTLTDNDLIMVVQDNENKKINKKDLQNNLTDPSLTKKVEELEKENAYLNNLVEQAFDKKEVEGEELRIDNTIEARMEMKLNGNTRQNTTTGKNLIKLYKATNPLVTNGLTFTRLDDNTLKIKGTSVIQCWIEVLYNLKNGTDVQTTPLFNLDVDNNYVFIAKNLSGTKDKDPTIFLQPNKENKTVSALPNTSISFSNSDGIYRGWIHIQAKTNFNDYTLQFQLEKGTTSTDFEPYTNGASPNPEYPQEIHCVKGNNVVKVTNQNLFDESVKTGNVATSKNNIISDSNGVLEIQGVSDSYSGIFKTYKLKAKTQYTISMQCDFVGENSFSTIKYKLGNESEKIRWSSSDGEIDVTPTNTIKSISFTTDSTGQVSIMFSCNGATNRGYVKYSHIQLEQNDTATNFVIPHSEEYPINLGNYELNSISDFKDHFKKENGKWYKVEKIKSIIVDGTNYLCIYMFPSGAFYIYSNAEKHTLQDAFKISGISLFSNYLISKTYTAVFDNGEIGATYNVGTGEIGVNVGISSNMEDINTWLSTHNLMIKYILQTPNKIEITDTTLINQLDEISQALSQKGTTIISQSNDDLSFNLDVIALTK